MGDYMLANFTIYDDYILINNVTEIKEFNDDFFLIKVNDIPYEINGENLSLKEVTNDNKSIKITGKINSLQIKNIKSKQNKSFIKKLFA